MQFGAKLDNHGPHGATLGATNPDGPERPISKLRP
jgi:hypothetical protein